MELRMGSLKPPLPSQKQPKKASRLAKPKKFVPTPRARPASPGLMDLEGLDTSHDVHATNIVHRGTMGSFQSVKPANKSFMGKNIPRIKSPEKKEEKRDDLKNSKSCPLCNASCSEENYNKLKSAQKIPSKKSGNLSTKTKSTSTKEIENVVAIRHSINLLGICIPIPVFIYMLLRILERMYQMFVTWIRHGPFHNVHFPHNLKISALKLLRDIRARFHFNPMHS